MMLKFFKQSLPQVIVVIILLAIIMWGQSIINNLSYPFYFDSIQMPFYEKLVTWLSNNLLLGKIVTLVAMLSVGFYLLHVNTKHIVIKQRTYLPAFFYFILTSSLIPLQQINPAVFASILMVFSLDHILSIYHKETVLDNLFRAGFYIAIASLFYAPAIFYFIAVIFSIASIRTFNLREWFAALFGLITPWFFYFLYQYIVNNDLSATYRILSQNLFTEVNYDHNSFLVYAFLAYCLIVFIISGFFLIKSLATQKINVRKYHGVFFWFNLVTITIIIFVPSVSIEIAYIGIIPITFHFAHYFTNSTRRFWPNFLFITLLCFLVLMQFYNV